MATPAARPSPTGSAAAARTSVIMRNRDDPSPLLTRGYLANSWERYLVRMQDLELRTTIAAMQLLRQRTNSVGLGGNGRQASIRAIEARLAAPVVGLMLGIAPFGHRVIPYGSLVLFPIGPHRYMALAITSACTSRIVVVPMLLLIAALLAADRTDIPRGLPATDQDRSGRPTPRAGTVRCGYSKTCIGAAGRDRPTGSRAE